jgi:mRNA-degrading endonuclease RelE of RelBE toxin-antitoxin system
MNIIVETWEFSRKVSQIWTEEELDSLKVFLSRSPDAGQLIPGTGGVRKVRWGGMGAGKRGGVRVIYFNKTLSEIWLLTIYAKSDKETVPIRELRDMRKEIDGL